jgi:asparagine synthetase B (glutamine-hydrolysing)
MQHSVEGRLPFLTRRLVDLALALPQEHLVGADGTTKLILKESMRGIVPDEVLDRPTKIGFAVPLRSWPARIPEMSSIVGSALDLPPVLGAPNHDLLDKAREPGALTRADAAALWRLVGLHDWVRELEVVFD